MAELLTIEAKFGESVDFWIALDIVDVNDVWVAKFPAGDYKGYVYEWRDGAYHEIEGAACAPIDDAAATAVGADPTKVGVFKIDLPGGIRNTFASRTEVMVRAFAELKTDATEFKFIGDARIVRT